MSFEVFRRHQRKLLAIFAILAMFGFVVSDSLPKLLSSELRRPRPAGRHTLRQDGLPERPQRDGPRSGPTPTCSSRELSPYIGQTSVRRDEGPRPGRRPDPPARGRPAGHPGRARDGPGVPQADHQRPDEPRPLRGRCSAGSTTGSAASSSSPTSPTRSAWRNVPRACSARRSSPPTTSSGPIATRTSGSRPSSSRSRSRSSWPRSPSRRRRSSRPYYDKYKDVLPDPAAQTPGFKVPRQIQVEILSIDGNALARGIKDKLTEAELRTAYENRKSEFEERRRRTAQRPLRRPARADPADHPAVRGRPLDPGLLAGRGEGPGRDRRQVRARSRTTC